MEVRRLNAADAPGKVKRAALAMFSSKECPLRYGDHALRASRDDRYGDLAPLLPRTLDVESPNLTFVEVEMTASGAVEKVVARLRTELKCGREHVDLVLVILRGGTVKTVWGNVASDKHKTLNRARLH
jgi:hypothetical protein